MAIISIVLGILSVYSLIIGQGYNIAAFIAFISIIFAIISIVRKREVSNKNLAITALIISGVILSVKLFEIIPFMISMYFKGFSFILG